MAPSWVSVFEKNAVLFMVKAANLIVIKLKLNDKKSFIKNKYS